MSSENCAFREHILLDMLDGISGITSKDLLGGFGLYKDGIIFAIIANQKIYFKVNVINQKMFGLGEQFSFMENNKLEKLPYWILPDQILKNPKELRKWVDMSVQITAQSRPSKYHKPKR